jgi:hypothetical protein
MYLYLAPQCGFNDILCSIKKCLNYCSIYNKILLLDTYNYSVYKINFSDYFDFPEDFSIIYDINEIKKICINKEISVYPDILNNKLENLVNGELIFSHNGSNNYDYQGHELSIPNENIEKNIIVVSINGGGDGYQIFKSLSFKNNIKEFCIQKYNSIDKSYLSIQVRNTDYKCEFENLYENHKDLIHSYNTIYIATDSKKVLDFFRSKNLNIINFTTFEDNNDCPLHLSNIINSDIKIKDVICDIFMIINSTNFLSCSNGGFIWLIKNCIENKNYIISKF